MADDELCFSPTCKLNNNPTVISTLFFYNLSLFIVSHPLYFSYFIFFSPYIFKFIFFISPLFFTTTALFILSVVPRHKKLGLVQTILDKLKSKLNEVDEDDEFRDFEDFEIYKIVFRDPPLVTVGDGDESRVTQMENVERSLESLFEELDRFEDSTVSTAAVEKPVTESISAEDQKTVQNSLQQLNYSSSFGSYKSTEDSTAEIEKPATESVSGEDKKTVQSLLQRLDYSTSFGSYESTEDSTAAVEKPVTESVSGEDQKTVQNSLNRLNYSSSFRSYESTEDSTPAIQMKANETRSQLEEFAGELHKSDDQKTVNSDSRTAANEKKLPKLEPAKVTIPVEDQKSVENSWRSDSCSSYGSMRKEKEWKRTLACKLFEERHNSEGGEEGMDSLWEAYEDNNNSSRKSKITKESMITHKKQKKKMTMKNKKTTEFKYFDDGDDEEDEDDDEFRSNGQLCCLKALKLSTGKMNLGMGKPNLVKISKAIKGFGWLHHVGSKHAKKV